jgi:hypothetical protein
MLSQKANRKKKHTHKTKDNQTNRKKHKQTDRLRNQKAARKAPEGYKNSYKRRRKKKKRKVQGDLSNFSTPQI